jgi:DNA-directed RNA polymerase subunit RPC12/RpoP
MKEMGIEDYLKYQKRRWSCPYCGGIVHFYHYKCSKCGKGVNV